MLKENDYGILRKYFNKWQQQIKIKLEKQTLNQRKMEQREKLDHLITVLKSKNKQQSAQQKHSQQQVVPVENYKNRYTTQKDTIEKLTMQLEQRDRLINDLKMGILNDEALKSLQTTKIEIREIFANCSTKIKLTKPQTLQYRNNEFTISINKAPKILQELEEKAKQRERNHQMILERKRLIDETRKRMYEIGLEKKRIQDEEEKRKNLEDIKRKREEQLKREQIRQRNKMIFMEKLDKSIKFHDQKLLVVSFRKLVKNYRNYKNNCANSIEHYNRHLLMVVFDRLKDNVEDAYRVKYQLADSLYNQKLLANYLQKFTQLQIDTRRNQQVAEDYCDFRLQLNVFLAWHRYVCIQIVEEDKKIKRALLHYNMKLMFNYFYQWRSLPAILQLERAKDLKKRRWREKVWEILPDYQPPDRF